MNIIFLSLARLIGQYCFARWRMSSVVGTWAVGRREAGRVGDWVVDTAWRASTVTPR